MTNSSVVSATNPYASDGSNVFVHAHQIRMELMVEASKDKVQVAGILRELLQRAAQGKQVTTFEDVHGKEFSIESFPTNKTFAQRLGVEQVTFGPNKKVILGFFVKTPKSFMDLKINVGFKWLQEKKVFLRIQNLSFEHGTDLSLIGYFIMDHPRFGIGKQVAEDIARAWAEATKEAAPGEDEERIEKMTQAGIIGELERGKGINIPVTVERNRMMVKSPGANKASFQCDVWHVLVPRKHYSDAVFLTDLAILEAKTLKSLIPASLAKRNAVVFYNQMKKHFQYMHEHRNVTIYNVNGKHYMQDETLKIGGQDRRHTTLFDLLESNEKIYRVYHNKAGHSLNLSVNVNDYDSILQWLRKFLPKFSFGPYIKDYNARKSTDSQKTDRYTQVFSVSSTEEGSFDPSTIASQKSRNPWNKHPPMELIFDVLDDEQFPNLPPKVDGKSSSQGTQQAGNPMDLSAVDTIVAKAIADQESKFTAQMAILEARNAKLEGMVKDLTDKIEYDMEKIVERMTATLTGSASPFFTKEDAAHMMERQTLIHDNTQTQLQHILQLLQGQYAKVHDDETAKSPPRKNQRIHEEPGTPTIRNGIMQDHPMTDDSHEEVSKS